MTNFDSENNSSVMTPGTQLPGVMTLFQEGLQYTVGHLKLVALLSSPFVILELVSYLTMGANTKSDNLNLVALNGIGGLVAIVFYVLFMAATLYMVAHQKHSPNYSQAMTWAKQNFWNLVWLSILTSLIVWGGFVLLLVPGIIVAIYMCLSQIVLVKEGKTGLAALLRSRQLVYGNWWAVALRLLGVQFLYFVGLLVIGAVVGGSSAFFANLQLSELVVNILFTVLGAAGAVIFINILLRIYQILSAQEKTQTVIQSAPDASFKYKFLGWLGLIMPLLLIALGTLGVFIYGENIDKLVLKVETVELEQSLNQHRHEAEKYYTNSPTQTYLGMCAELQPFSTNQEVQVVCNDSAEAYAISATTVAGETRCVDSTGYNKIIYTDLAERTRCLDVSES